jgi:hypothetical protein
VRPTLSVIGMDPGYPKTGSVCESGQSSRRVADERRPSVRVTGQSVLTRPFPDVILRRRRIHTWFDIDRSPFALRASDSVHASGAVPTHPGAGQPTASPAGVMAHPVALRPVPPRGALGSTRAGTERAQGLGHLLSTSEGHPIDRAPFSLTARLVAVCDLVVHPVHPAHAVHPGHAVAGRARGPSLANSGVPIAGRPAR